MLLQGKAAGLTVESHAMLTIYECKILGKLRDAWSGYGGLAFEDNLYLLQG